MLGGQPSLPVRPPLACPSRLTAAVSDSVDMASMTALLRQSLESARLEDFADTSDDDSYVSSIGQSSSRSSTPSPRSDSRFDEAAHSHAELLKSLGMDEDEPPFATPEAKHGGRVSPIPVARGSQAAAHTPRGADHTASALSWGLITGAPIAGSPDGVPIAVDPDLIRLRQSVSVLHVSLRKKDALLDSVQKQHQETTQALDRAQLEVQQLRYVCDLLFTRDTDAPGAVCGRAVPQPSAVPPLSQVGAAGRSARVRIRAAHSGYSAANTAAAGKAKAAAQ